MAGGGGGEDDDNPVPVNCVALIDIIFCLCLFFMCSLKFRPLAGKLDSWMPKIEGAGRGAPRPRGEPIRVVLSFDRDTNQVQRLLGMRPIPGGSVGDELLAWLLREQAAQDKSLGHQDVPVIIDSGPGVPWQAVVDVMNMTREADLSQIEFAFGTPFESR